MRRILSICDEANDVRAAAECGTKLVVLLEHVGALLELRRLDRARAHDAALGSFAARLRVSILRQFVARLLR